MSLRYDYHDVLMMMDGDDTYESWAPRIQFIEDSAMLTASRLNQDYDSPTLKDVLEKYCKERVIVELLGSDMSASLLKWHQSLIADCEEGLLYYDIN